MPFNSAVHKIYEAMVREGMSKGKAARIAQSKTHLSLQTGKPPKTKRGRSVPKINKRSPWQL